jgi:hypothetical protein
MLVTNGGQVNPITAFITHAFEPTVLPSLACMLFLQIWNATAIEPSWKDDSNKDEL